MNESLENIIEDSRKYIEKGKVATYIPELGKVDENILGISVVDLNNNVYHGGNFDAKFTIQSISKPIALILALMDNGEEIFEKVGKEPTGDPFNSLKRLASFATKKPLNPMINAGAIAVTSMIKGNNSEEKIERILNLFKLLTGNDSLNINNDVYKSELRTGNRNRSIAYFLKDNGIIEGNVDEVLDVYFKQCSIEISCLDLANIGAVLANDGRSVVNGERIIPSRYATIAKAFMLTCGMYDSSGEFVLEVGFPAKSGVSGGIMCSIPHKMGIGVIGPALDSKGNSVAGVEVLKKLSSNNKLSLFD